MSRVQLALNVENIDEAVAFYTTLFDTPPAKRRPGYANFAVTDPALKLVLFESPGRSGTLNHLGVERATMDEAVAQADHLEAAGLDLDVEGDVASS
jgi:catechol 2,3-dioxygenase-like lactoylglutathione lyase family enzyme